MPICTVNVIIVSLFLFKSLTTSAAPLEQTLTVMSDYRSDGVSQTMEKPAFQWSGDSVWNIDETQAEIYGRWFTSNIRFQDEKGYEFDLGLGTRVTLAGLQWDFGLLNNFHFSVDSVDEYFLELYAGVFVNENSTLYFTYADDRETFDGGKNATITWDQSYSLAQNFNWSYQLGYTDMYRSRLSNSDYFWWTTGIHYNYGEFLLSLDYHNTDIRRAVDFYDIAQDSIVFSAAVIF